MNRSSAAWTTLALVLAFMLPAVDATTSSWSAPVTEVIVEGHTVFTVLSAGESGNASMMRSGAAAPASQDDSSVAGSQEPISGAYMREPGARWFNDQHLVGPRIVTASSDELWVGARFSAAVAVLVERTWPGNHSSAPCGGAVLLVNTGDPDPRDLDTPLVSTGNVGSLMTRFGYTVSYLVTDPNDATWIIDRYDTLQWVDELRIWQFDWPVFVVNIHGGPVFRPDLGDACPAVVDRPPAGFAEPSDGGFCYHGPAVTPSGCESVRDARRYNALFYLPLEILEVEYMPMSHAEPGMATNGCQLAMMWSCPSGDDDFEGDSHGFRPVGAPGGEGDTCPAAYPGAGRANHGGSTQTTYDCDGVHATYLVDIYYSPSSRPPTPLVRSFSVLDLQGSAAPFGSVR